MLHNRVGRRPDGAACGAIRVCDHVLPDYAASGSIRATMPKFNVTQRGKVMRGCRACLVKASTGKASLALPS